MGLSREPGNCGVVREAHQPYVKPSSQHFPKILLKTTINLVKLYPVVTFFNGGFRDLKVDFSGLLQKKFLHIHRIELVLLLMRKKNYHHSDLKQALFLSCHRFLKKIEPEKISLRLVAEEIGVSHAAIYRHFKDKEALLEVMATHGFKRLARAQKNALEKETTAESGFLRAGVAYIKFAIRNPFYYKNMFLTKRSNPSEELRKSMLRSYSILIGACRNYLREKGRTNDPREFALMSWSLVHGYSSLYMETGFPKSEAGLQNKSPIEFAEEILKNIL